MSSCLASCLASCIAVRAVRPEPVPKGVREIRDLTYAHLPEPDRGRLDLYIPPGQGPHPVLVFIHGGYWQAGSRNTEFGVYRRLGRRLAARGVLAVVPSYRLAPAYPYPAQIKDVARALASVRANIQAYGGDPNRITVMGHSAGGHLVLTAALDPRWLRAEGAAPSAFRGFISISGIYDVNDLATDPAGQRNVTRVFGSNESAWTDASPIRHLKTRASVPPIMLAIGDADSPVLIREYEAMKHALAGRGSLKTVEAADRTHMSIITELLATDREDPLGEAVVRFAQR